MHEIFDDDADTDAAAVTTLRRDHGDIAQFTRSIAEASTSGVDLDWSGSFAGHPASVVELPTYAFQRDHFWPRRRQPAAIRSRQQRKTIVRAVIAPPGFRPASTALGLERKYLILVPDSLPDHPAVAMVEHAVTTHGATAHVHRVDPLAERAALAEQLTSLSTAHEPTAIISLLALDTTAHPGYPAIPSGLAATITLAQAHADTHRPAPTRPHRRYGASLRAPSPPRPPIRSRTHCRRWPGGRAGWPPWSIHVCGAA